MTEQVASGQGARLRPDEWKSGDRLWLIELVAPFATIENKMQDAMIADIAKTALAGSSFKFHVADPKTGKRKVVEFQG